MAEMVPLLRQAEYAEVAQRAEAFRGMYGETIWQAMASHLAEQARKRKEALRKAQEEAAAAAAEKRWEDANAAALAAQEVPEKAPEGVAITTFWEPVGVDLRRVPVEFLSVDLPALRRAAREQVKEGAEAPEIEGVE